MVVSRRRRGRKRHEVTIENPARVADGEGGWIETWTPATPPTTNASIEPATARDLERVTSGTSIATASHVVVMDYHPAVTVATRLRFDGRIFEVAGVQNIDERDVELVLACTELVDEAGGAARMVGRPGGSNGSSERGSRSSGAAGPAWLEDL